jgi:hypothetical protein
MFLLSSPSLITLVASPARLTAADSAGYSLPSSGVASTTQFYLGPELSGGTACGVKGVAEWEEHEREAGWEAGISPCSCRYSCSSLSPAPSFTLPRLPTSTPRPEHESTNYSLTFPPGRNQPARLRRQPICRYRIRRLLLDNPRLVLGRGALRQCTQIHDHRRASHIRGAQRGGALQAVQSQRAQRHERAVALRHGHRRREHGSI